MSSTLCTTIVHMPRFPWVAMKGYFWSYSEAIASNYAVVFEVLKCMVVSFGVPLHLYKYCTVTPSYRSHRIALKLNHPKQVMKMLLCNNVEHTYKAPYWNSCTKYVFLTTAIVSTGKQADDKHNLMCTPTREGEYCCVWDLSSFLCSANLTHLSLGTPTR